MGIKQLFCKHDWKKQTIRLTNIAIVYTANSPVEEFRTYVVAYHCYKCDESQTREKYVERGLTDEERRILVEESIRYGKAIGV